MNVSIQIQVMNIERIGPSKVTTLEKSVDALLRLLKEAEDSETKHMILDVADACATKLKRKRGWCF